MGLKTTGNKNYINVAKYLVNVIIIGKPDAIILNEMLIFL